MKTATILRAISALEMAEKLVGDVIDRREIQPGALGTLSAECFIV